MRDFSFTHCGGLDDKKEIPSAGIQAKCTSEVYKCKLK